MDCLITSAASAKAYQLKKQLIDCTVLLGDYQELPEVMLKSGQMIQLPSPQSPSYAHLMLTLCLDKQIEQVHVLNFIEAALLREALQLFNEYGIELIFYPDDL